MSCSLGGVSRTHRHAHITRLPRPVNCDDAGRVRRSLATTTVSAAGRAASSRRQPPQQQQQQQGFDLLRGRSAPIALSQSGLATHRSRRPPTRTIYVPDMGAYRSVFFADRALKNLSVYVNQTFYLKIYSSKPNDQFQSEVTVAAKIVKYFVKLKFVIKQSKGNLDEDAGRSLPASHRGIEA